VPLGLDEMNCRKGDCNLTVFCDLVARLVGFATAGNDHTTFPRFAWELLKHIGNPKAITAVGDSPEETPARWRAWEELGNAQIVFDPFHVTALVAGALVAGALDDVRRREAASSP